MRVRTKIVAGLLVGSLGFAWAGVARAEDAPLEVRLVDQLNALFGSHAGFRANHAKGAVFEGTFTPSPEAAALTTATHLQSTPVPFTLRFSNAGGLPDAPDNHPSAAVRGVAIKFHLPDGTDTDLIGITLHSFPVRTGDDFLALLHAVELSGPNVPHPSPIETFMGAHPVAAKVLGAPLPMPVSYATVPFYGIDAFKFTNAKGESHFVRYQIIPEAGEAYVSAADAAKRAPDALSEDMRTRLATAPVKFKLQVQVAASDDKTDDATIVWPDSRPIMQLGELVITKPVADSLEAQKQLLFMPTNLTAGIEPSADPLIDIRTAAYAVSFGRRTQ